MGHGADDQPWRLAMQVRNIHWVGVPARNYEAMVTS
jgi:hypothetical protein